MKLKRSFLDACRHYLEILIFFPAQIFVFKFSQPSMISLTVCPIQQNANIQILPNKLQKSSWNAVGFLSTKMNTNLESIMLSKKILAWVVIVRFKNMFRLQIKSGVGPRMYLE